VSRRSAPACIPSGYPCGAAVVAITSLQCIARENRAAIAQMLTEAPVSPQHHDRRVPLHCAPEVLRDCLHAGEEGTTCAAGDTRGLARTAAPGESGDPQRCRDRREECRPLDGSRRDQPHLPRTTGLPRKLTVHLGRERQLRRVNTPGGVSISGDQRELPRAGVARCATARIERVVFPKECCGPLGKHGREIPAHLAVRIDDATHPSPVIRREGSSESDRGVRTREVLGGAHHVLAVGAEDFPMVEEARSRHRLHSVLTRGTSSVRWGRLAAACSRSQRSSTGLAAR